ncbi:MAG: histone deacetylase family protein [Candidatus Diapherotrites archaeon]|nr:histone deacetylase family protein [Candidatus Diapherotrites archaeon]
MDVFYSDKQKTFIPPNPDIPDRVEAIKDYLERAGGYKFHNIKSATKKDLLLVHTDAYIEIIESCKEKELYWLTPDTPVVEAVYELAKIAAGGAIRAAEKEGFALIRPPGHHAGSDYGMGFCYFNNIAIAVRKMQEKGVKKAFIIDIDAHHGNGTQDIFFNDKNVFYFSIQQDPTTVFPGIPAKNNDHVINMNSSAGAEDNDFMAAFENVKKYALKFKPELIAVSAGFDTWHNDNMTDIKIKDMNTYRKIGEIISGLGKELDAKTFVVLEGGYCINVLGALTWNFLQGLKS